MGKEILLLAFGMISLLGVWGVFAQDYICNNGVCIYHGRFNVSGDSAGIRITPVIAPGCAEKWSCPCVNGAIACTDENACGTTNTMPTNNGQSCSSPNNGGGGGGGGYGDGSSGSSGSARVSECVELWQCGDWSECIDGKQTRTCYDISKCSTTALKPNTEKTCAIEEQEPNVEVNEESTKSSGILGAVLGALGNLGKSKAAVAIIFIALVIAASLIISAVRGEPPAVTGGAADAAVAEPVK